MTKTMLHLVDRQGVPVSSEVGDAVKPACDWAQRQFTLIDPALIATWAEEIAVGMAERDVRNPRRYAVAALHGKIREFYRAGGMQETSVGASQELERWVGVDAGSTTLIERSILFDQLRAHLNERDRVILVLLLQDLKSPNDIAEALGMSYDAAAKASQRVRERLRKILTSTSSGSALGKVKK